MSRSGYVDYDDYGGDYPDLALGRYRAQVASATRGKRGQVFFRDLLKALDDMPDKRLIANELEADGQVCAIGALGRARNVDMAGLDPEDAGRVSTTFNIAEQLAREVVYANDEGSWSDETPEARWVRMRKWVAAQIKDALGDPA